VLQLRYLTGPPQQDKNSSNITKNVSHHKKKRTEPDHAKNETSVQKKVANDQAASARLAAPPPGPHNPECEDEFEGHEIPRRPDGQPPPPGPPCKKSKPYIFVNKKIRK